ncbi:MAG: SUMF1/EgtB/PvdO family nonheme iron enzyme, partial [Bacteroidota bacterium]
MNRKYSYFILEKKAGILLNLLVLICFSSIAQEPTKPEKVHSITKVAHPLAYYQEQATLWKTVLDESPAMPMAWVNHYFACRMANLLRGPQQAPFYDLHAIIEQAHAAIPSTYENHFLAYLDGGIYTNHYEHLERAYAIAPERTEVYKDLFTHYELTRQHEKAQEFAQKLIDCQDFSPGILRWGYNLLMSVEDHAVLITHGDNDTYPLWLLQRVQRVRPDVTVLNIHLLQLAAYRKQLFTENQIPALANQSDQVPTHQQLLQHLFDHVSHPVYLAATLSAPIREQYSADLYLTGLALKYSQQEFDNLSLLKKNVENRFLLDHFKTTFYPDFSASVLDQMNANYLPAFILLHQAYQREAQIAQAQQVKTWLKQIAAAAGMKSEMRNYFDRQSSPNTNAKPKMGWMNFQQEFKTIRKNLKAARTEVSNETYHQFLLDLLQQKAYEQLDRCRPQAVNWRQLAQKRLLPASAPSTREVAYAEKNQPIADYTQVSEATLFGNIHPDDARAPVQNISFEAAQRYCEWLNRRYHEQPIEQRAFKKVIFRLPTETEWEYAASSGQEQRSYPWGTEWSSGKGDCYRGNINAVTISCPEQAASHAGEDGGFFPIAVDAYLENEFGLYNLSGNVAEMLAEKGKAKGGSWA